MGAGVLGSDDLGYPAPHGAIRMSTGLRTSVSGKRLRRARQAAACVEAQADRGTDRYPEGATARELAALRPPVDSRAAPPNWVIQ